MFLKFAKNPSITARLTLFYCSTTFLLLTVIAFCLYGTTLHILHHANYQFLSDEVNILQNLLKNKPSNRLALEQEIIEVPYAETGSVYRYYIRILDHKKNIVIATPQMEAHLHNASFFNQQTMPTKNETIWWQASSGKHYLLMQSPVNFSNHKPSLLIQIALDVSYQKNIINLYVKLLGLILILGTMIAILLGYLIARRGMKSLYKLTDTAQKITASSLHQRIVPHTWPKELNTLGITFNQMLDRIEDSFLHLTQFSADLAHELRTPVNNLQGEIEIALSRSNSTIPEYQQVLVSNLEELQRISHIIENLLFLARAENPQVDLKKSYLNVAEEIRVICDFYQAMTDEKNIQISCEGQAQLNANSIMFRRLISNLLSNAIKYTPDHGQIAFHLQESEDHQVTIVLRDNGIGIAPEHLPHIFQRFYRVDSARSHHSGGIGLGLAIAKSIIDLHHGSISITSKLAEGTTITLIFPRG